MENLLETEEYTAYLSAMEKPARRSLRVNTLKIGTGEFLALTGNTLEPTGINKNGFCIPDDFPVGSSPLHAAGLFYMQEASAQYPAILLDVKPGETVLDLCAAPGGKTGQLAAAMENTGLLLANEIVPSRVAVLDGNLERLGVRNAVITNMHPDALCPLLPSFFDAILVDAPCSGEGMFRKEPDAVLNWSEANAKACAERQLSILKSAAPCVKPGGRLVYSTCTFSKEENEETVEKFLSLHPEFTLKTRKRFYPFNSKGEGQFAALLVKDGTGTEENGSDTVRSENRQAETLAQVFLNESTTKVPSGQLYALKDGRVFLLPGRLPLNLSKMRIKRSGVLLGESRNGRFEPAHCLYMAFPASWFKNAVSLEDTSVQKFLSGETVPCDSILKGYLPVLYRGFTLGFGKASSGILKNHLPKGLRIRNL